MWRLKNSWFCIQPTNIWVFLNCQKRRHLQSEVEQREIVLFSSGTKRRLNFPVLLYLRGTKWWPWDNRLLPTSSPFLWSSTLSSPFFFCFSADYGENKEILRLCGASKWKGECLNHHVETDKPFTALLWVSNEPLF